MIRKIAHIGIWLVLIAWLLLILGFVDSKNHELICGRLAIEISDSTELNFVSPNTVRELIQESGINTQGYPIEEINTRKIESMLERDPYISNAEVFFNIEGALFVDIEQRKPLLRVMPKGKDGYYIDSEGALLPLSASYAPMVMLVSGNIDIPTISGESGLEEVDMQSKGYVRDLLAFAEYAGSHAFWKNQIVQVYRSNNGDFEVIPRVGAHQIIMGDLHDYRTKLKKLQLLYEQGFDKYGWNTYNIINLKYSNQIICTKR